MKKERNTFRSSSPVQRSPEISSIGGCDGGCRSGDLKDKNRLIENCYQFRPARNSRTRSASKQSFHAEWVGPGISMTGTGSRDRSIIFDSDEKISPLMILPIGQTNHRFDKIFVAQGARPLPLEFDVDRFTSSDQIPDLFWSHSPLSLEWNTNGRSHLNV
jgi:hypothetical protein